MVKQLNVLMLHDLEYENDRGTVRWAYANRTHGLAKAAPDWCNVTRMSIPDAVTMRMNGFDPLHGIDVVLNLDYQSATHVRSALMAHSGIPMVSSFNKDSSANSEYWTPCKLASDYIICNNADRFEWAIDRSYDRCCYISNGVDTDFWRPLVPIEDRKYVVGWCGSMTPKKGKGYQDIVEPVAQALAPLPVSVRPILHAQDRAVFCAEDQRRWYNQCQIILCASKTEGGGPSSLMEAMACGCIPVTVSIGGVPEFGVHGDNCFIAARSREAFLGGIRQVLGDEDFEGLSKSAQQSMQRYSYGSERGPDKWFYRLLLRVAEGVEVEPFNYLERDWDTL